MSTDNYFGQLKTWVKTTLYSTVAGKFFVRRALEDSMAAAMKLLDRTTYSADIELQKGA